MGYKEYQEYYMGLYHNNRLVQMSFESEYIEKYGQRAVQAYKRSLRHSDVTQTAAKGSIEKRTLKRSSSCGKHAISRKATASPYLSKGPKNASKHDNKKQGQPNSLRLFINPSKKKLVISDLSTPKETPSKSMTTRKNPQSKVPTTTNVNVYVNAVHRSKSKESTPCRDLHEKGYTHAKQRTRRKGPSLLSKIELVSTLLADSLNQYESKNIHRAIEVLGSVHRSMGKVEKRQQKQEALVRNIRELVGCGLRGKVEERSDYVQQLEAEVQNYMEKEQHLLKIIESLTLRKQIGQTPQLSQQEEQEEEEEK